MKFGIATNLLAGIAATLIAGCSSKAPSANVPVARQELPPLNPLAVVLAPHVGETKADREIRRRQELIRAGKQIEINLERLGWLFVAKARETFDAGYYKLAEQCAFALERSHDASSQQGGRGALAAKPGPLQGGDEGVAATRAAVLLLRGHVLQNLHRFVESETVARELVDARGLAFDYGVLGDALMEQGKLDEAVEAYQQMADLKPDSQAATRAAHIRWLKGDLKSAIEAMELAAGAIGARDSESAAWVFTRLATYQFQAGGFEEADRVCASALDLRTDYPPALLLRGKILLAQNKSLEAVEALRSAEKQNPLPEYQWALADALEAAGRFAEARAVENRLRRTGASADPRSFALFLATRGEKSELALRLAHEELTARADVFTHDAIAWAELANGNLSQARRSIAWALAEGTQDARLFFHAAVIASRAGQTDDAEKFFQKSSALAHLLLPSERKHLHTVAAGCSSHTQSRRR